MSRRKPVPFNGVEYQSQAALAEAVGVMPTAVSMAIKRGRLHSLGMPRKEAFTSMHLARRQPCAALGWKWPSQTEAARALGCNDKMVHYYLDRGRFEELVRRRLGVRGAGPDGGSP